MNLGLMKRRAAQNIMANPYITDGLIAMFDAEWNVGLGKHEESPESWKDLVGNITLSGVPSKFNANSVLMDNTMSFESQAILDAINKDELTVEMILKPLNHGTNNNNMYIRLGSTRGFWLWDNRNHVFSSTSYREPSNGFTSINSYGWSTGIILKNVIACVSLYGNNLKIRANSAYNFSVSFTNKATVTGTHLFGNSTSNMEIYCVRFYGKVLSQAEIAHNALIDKERFGLNI